MPDSDAGDGTESMVGPTMDDAWSERSCELRGGARSTTRASKFLTLVASSCLKQRAVSYAQCAEDER